MIEQRQKAEGLPTQDVETEIVEIERRVGLPQTRRVAVAFDAAFAGRRALEIALDISRECRRGIDPALRQQAEAGLMRAEMEFRQVIIG